MSAIFLKLFVLWGYLCCTIKANSNSTSVFVAVAPKLIRPNSVLKVFISAEESGSPKEYSIQITNANLSVAIVAERINIEPGKTAIISLPVKELRFSSYELSISENGDIIDRTAIHTEKNNFVTFIQTDKPIYKPGETVRFRVIVLDRKFRPIPSTPEVNIFLYDPNKNLIKSWKRAKVVHNGLLSKSLELSEEPNLGDWLIKLEANSEIYQQSFTVAQYVLPKFKVEIKLPNFVTVDNSKIIADISAKYTYGKPATGKLIVTLSAAYQFQYFRRRESTSNNLIPQKIIKILSLDGASAIAEFDAVKDLKLEIGENFNERELTVQATFTETLTGLEQNATSTVKLYKHPYKITLENPPESYKPGFPLHLTLKVATQDNIPVSDENPNAVLITHGFTWKDKDGYLNYSIPANGLVHLTLDTPSNEQIVIHQIQATYKGLSTNIILPPRYTSYSKAYIQLDRNQNIDNKKDKNTLFLKVATSKIVGPIKYIIVCRWEIISMNIIGDVSPEQMSSNKGHEFSVAIPPSCNQKGQIIAYTIYPQPEKNEIIADTVKFDTGRLTLSNYLKVNISTQTAQPGNDISLSLQSQPNSLIALRAVDQSVLLLKEDKDIDMQSVVDNIKSKDGVLFKNTMFGAPVLKIFDQGGVVVLTNGFIERPKPVIMNNFEFQPMFLRRNKPAPMMMPMMVMAGAPQADFAVAKQAAPVMESSARESPAQNIQVRTHFPETWIFDEINSTEMVTHLSKTVPDTITSWIITGFCINSENGLGLSENPTKLTTFRPFFISLNLPYSVVSGEIVALQILVHNYLEETLKVEVTVDNDQGVFEYIESNQQSGKSLMKTIQVTASNIASVSFLVKPIKFGIKKITVKAVSDFSGDGITQPLIIKPPGVKYTKNEAVLVDLRPDDSESPTVFQKNLTAEFPAVRVADADSVKLTLIGDMLGSTVSNLDSLLAMPTGCGEQNMLNFVVDVVVLEYLSATGTLTPPIKEKAVGFLEKGYQRQLGYLRKDGSFSAFGNSDSFGSTWLTAFVIRSFIQAKPYITIDDDVILRSLQYLSERQQQEGEFEELGRIIHSDMKGGVGSGGLAMSAYTLLAFMEAAKTLKIMAYAPLITKGLNHVANNLDKFKKDVYAINLIAYTFQQAKHPSKEQVIELMEILAKRNGDLKYWQQKSVASPKYEKDGESPQHLMDEIRREQINKRFYGPPVTPATVEMTAYALLTTLGEKNKMADSLQIAKWLTTQRNCQGGFMSTQDTVVAITALAKFGLSTRTPNSKMKISVDYTAKGKHEFEITKDNELELQEMILPQGVQWVNLKATGEGTALAQLTWSYNLDDKNTLTPVFDLRAKIRKGDNAKKFAVSVCSMYTAGGKKTNMALLEVELPTGFSFEKEMFEQSKTPDVLRYETANSDSKVVIYFDHMDSEDRCIEIWVSLSHPVAEQAPANIVLYDYYDTTRKSRISYLPPKISACDICRYDKTCKIQNCV